MKRILILFAVMVCAASGVRAADFNALWDRANTAYVNADYEGAIQAYDSIIAGGMVSSKLYYNLGNAYFKSGHTGKALLYYHKAQRIAPSDKDIAYNIAVANGYVKDRIEPMPEFFGTRWVRALRTSASSNTWAVVSIVVLALMLISLLLYLLPFGIRLRKTGFAFAVVFFAVLCVTVSFASVERSRYLNPSEAIVMSSAASVKSSPDASSKDIFVIHEGTVVSVIDHLGNWTEVSIADGNKGWILNSSIALID